MFTLPPPKQFYITSKFYGEKFYSRALILALKLGWSPPMVSAHPWSEHMPICISQKTLGSFITVNSNFRPYLKLLHVRLLSQKMCMLHRLIHPKKHLKQLYLRHRFNQDIFWLLTIFIKYFKFTSKITKHVTKYSHNITWDKLKRNEK